MGVDGFSGRSALNRLSQNKKATPPALVGVLANKKRRSEVPDESPDLSRHPVRGVAGGDADNGKNLSWHPVRGIVGGDADNGKKKATLSRWLLCGS